MTGPDARGERGTGDPFRQLWLEGNMRPPFCTRGQHQGVQAYNIGCRYCWPETCLWEQTRMDAGMSIDAPISGDSGRHRAPARLGPFRSLLRMHRRSQRNENPDA